MTEKEKTVDANANNASENTKKNDKEKKKKAGIIIGVVGLSVAAAIAAAAGAKGCAPNERSYTITYLTDDEVQNFQGGSVNVKEGTSIGDLKRQLAPLDGYEVEGFYKDPDCTLEFKDDDKITGDEKIYIQYKQVEITLIFHNDENPSDNSFENMTVMYFDNLSEKEMPTPESYTSGEGNYTFKCWKTRDGKVVDLKSMTSGKDLLEVDADGEIDLYAEFDFEAAQTYSLNFDSSKVKITKNGKELTPQDRVFFNDELVVEGVADGDWVCSIGSVTGLEIIEGSTYKVSGDVEVTGGKVEHRYLIFTLKYDDTYEVEGMKEGATETHIVIPDNHYDGKKITSIFGNYSGYEGKIISRSGAFMDNINIESVIFGKYITNIDACAFYGCSKLTSLALPETVTAVGYYSFYDTDISNVEYSGSVDTWVYNHFCEAFNKGYKLTTKEGLVTKFSFTSNVPVGALAYVTSLQRVTIDDSVTEIGDSAFYECIGLTDIDIKVSSKIQSIGGSAFYDCINMTEITIPSGVQIIGGSAFYGCIGLTEIAIPSGVHSIGYSAFRNTGIKSIDTLELTNDSGVIIGSYALENIEFNNLKITKLNSLGECPFGHVKNLTVDSWATLYVHYGQNYSISADVLTLGVGFGGVGLVIDDIGNGESHPTEDGVIFENIGEVRYLGTLEQWNQTYFSLIVHPEPNCYHKNKFFKIKFDGNPLNGASKFYVNGDELVTDIEINYDVGAWVFCGYQGLANVKITGKNVKINEGAFYGCSNAKCIVDSTEIDAFAFDGPTIYFTGSEEEWNDEINTLGNWDWYGGIMREFEYEYNSDHYAYTTSTNSNVYYYSSDSQGYRTWHYDEDGVTPVVWTKENQ